MALVATPFFQITLPLLATFIASIWAATWMQNKHVDSLEKRLDPFEASMENIEKEMRELNVHLRSMLTGHSEGVTELEAARWR